jgi:hypothetical protein
MHARKQRQRRHVCEKHFCVHVCCTREQSSANAHTHTLITIHTRTHTTHAHTVHAHTYTLITIYIYIYTHTHTHTQTHTNREAADRVRAQREERQKREGPPLPADIFEGPALSASSPFAFSSDMDGPGSTSPFLSSTPVRSGTCVSRVFWEVSHVCMYIYIYIYIYMHTYIYIHTPISLVHPYKSCASSQAHILIKVYTSHRFLKSKPAYYIYIYIYIYIHTHTYAQAHPLHGKTF